MTEFLPLLVQIPVAGLVVLVSYGAVREIREQRREFLAALKDQRTQFVETLREQRAVDTETIQIVRELQVTQAKLLERQSK